MKETIKICNCEKHGEYQAKVKLFWANEIVQACQLCTQEEKELAKREEEKAKQQKRMQNIALNIELASLPKRYSTMRDFEFKGTQNALKDYKFESNLILYGSPGSGKTFVASYLALKGIYKGKSARYIYANEIEKKAKEAWGTKYSENDMLKPYIDCDILILDEIGRVKYSDYLFKVLDERYMQEKITIFLGNIDIKDIPRLFGDAIASRLRENVQAVSFGTEDYRKPSIF